jgi:hypothetical protein
MRHFVEDRALDRFSKPTMVERRARKQERNGLGIVTPEVINILEGGASFGAVLFGRAVTKVSRPSPRRRTTPRHSA